MSHNTIASLPNSFPGTDIVTKSLCYSQFGHIPIARCSITSWRNFSWPSESRGVPTCGGYLGTTRSHRRRLRLRLCIVHVYALLKNKKKNGYRDEAGGRRPDRISRKTRRAKKKHTLSIIICDSNADRGRKLRGTHKNLETKKKKFLSGYYIETTAAWTRFCRIIPASESRMVVKIGLNNNTAV